MFGYDAPVVQRYPTIRAGVIHATGPRNGPSSPDLLEASALDAGAGGKARTAPPVEHGRSTLRHRRPARRRSGRHHAGTW